MKPAMTREKLIEVMARAICKMEYGDPDGFSAITLADTERTTPRWHYCAPTARAALAAIEAAGLRVMPVEATGGMQADGRDIILSYFNGPLRQPVKDQWQIAREVYSAMIAASPLAKEEG